MKRSTKKGFTIVELVIVIAIIAILAAVLIPTFASLIQKANESKDTQLVKNLNTALVADNKEHKTMTDALDAAVEFGYDVGKINASATNKEILWDSKNDVFCYYDTNTKTPEYIPETSLKNGAIESNETYKLWKIYTEAPTEQTFSIYWNSDKAFDKELTVGFDAGSNTAITALTYKGTAGNSVIIRTNSYDTVLTIDAVKDSVKHFDKVGSVVITAVAPKSYHEFGDVQGNISLANGRVVMESGSKASAVKVTATADDVSKGNATVAVDNTAAPTVAVVVPADVKTALEKAGGDNKLNASNDSVITDETTIANMDKFAGGLGTEDSPYLIATVDELTNINKVNDTKGVFVKLANNLVISYDKLTKMQWTGYDWYTYCAVTNFNGVFDGAGYEIVLPDATNFSDGKSAAFATLINTSYFGIIKNITLTQGTLINNAHSVTAEKIITRGNLSFENNSGMIIGNAYDKATLIDCRNEANINSTSYSAVFVGYATTENLELSFTNCVNAGAYIGVKSSMFLGNIPSSDKKVKMIVTNCGNVENGLIRTTETASSYKWNSYVSTFANAKNINIVLNGETIDLERTLSSGFAQGPNDTLAISKNDNNTFNITKSNIDTVSYYVIRVYVYANSTTDSGTQMFAVEEKIMANSDLKTTAKYLGFTMEKLTGNGTICGWNVVTKDGVDYYSFQKDGYTISNGTKPNVSIIAYDANGNVLSSATLSK